MLKSFYAAIASCSFVALAPAGELHIEQFAPETSVVVWSVDGGQAMLERVRNSSAKTMLDEPMESFKDDMMKEMSGPVVDMMKQIEGEIELIEMISTKCEWGPDKKVHMHVGILIDSITVESPPSAEKAAAEETADA